MRKQYGQNFLINPRARARLLDALEVERDSAVWEIGPGLGAMTEGLLLRGARVCAFEIDRGFTGALTEFFGGNARFTLIEGDVMKTWPGAVPAGDYLLANLPYTIGAALLADFIEKDRFFTRMVVTVQKETARRMMARPGAADYSSFSVLCASSYRISPLLTLKGGSFYPEPRVESQGVRLDLIEDGIFRTGRAPALLKPLIRALFSYRRKTVKNNLQTFIASRGRSGGEALSGGALQNAALAALSRSGVAPTERVERLGLPELARLAESLETIIDRQNQHQNDIYDDEASPVER
jgi:16S rRNA (adenine1518-N6/adenine1519-N6)-dimethyltransferase